MYKYFTQPKTDFYGTQWFDTPELKQRVVIGLLGAVGAGKTTLSDCVRGTNITRIAFGDTLKDIALREGAWNGQKDPVSRKQLQDFSEHWKKLHGEFVFFNETLKTLNELTEQVVIIDDFRFSHELSWLFGDHDFSVHDVYVFNYEAEQRWLSSFLGTAETDAWAKHRSETEWRTVRDYIELEFDNSSSGQSNATQRFANLVKSLVQMEQE